ncbi:MAG: hypothetical protein HRF49_11520 [bacterium]|jgi:hypothetical protein
MAEIIKATTTEVVVNEDGGQIDFRVEGDTLASIIYAGAAVDKVLLGADVVSSLDARVTCRQTVSNAAIPVLELSQSDADEPFIKFSGTSASACGQCVLITTATGVVDGPKRARSGEYGLYYADLAALVEFSGNKYYIPLFICEYVQP